MTSIRKNRPPLLATVSNRVGGLKLREAPSMAAKVKTELAPGDRVEIIRDGGVLAPGWSHVRVAWTKTGTDVGKSGWEATRHLDFDPVLPEAPPPRPVPQPTRAKPVPIWLWIVGVLLLVIAVIVGAMWGWNAI